MTEILTDNTRKRHGNDPKFEANEDVRLTPEDVANVSPSPCPSHVVRKLMLWTQTYLYLIKQNRSAWTWEQDRT